jgi:hypothetical protein
LQMSRVTGQPQGQETSQRRDNCLVSAGWMYSLPLSRHN